MRIVKKNNRQKKERQGLLIDQLPRDVTQIWYAAAIGSLTDLRAWWEELSTHGPKYGYYANAAKTWLVTKENVRSEALEIFSGTAVNILSWKPLGSQSFVEEFVHETWKAELLQLCQWAGTQLLTHTAGAVDGLS